MRFDRTATQTAILSAAVFAALSRSSVAIGADKFWDGSPGNGNWTFAGNWFGGLPGAFDTAKFDAASSVVQNIVRVDQASAVSEMFIDGIPPSPASPYEFQSVSNAQLFVGNDLTIAGLAANSTPVRFNSLNVDMGRLVLGANGTLLLTGATSVHAANGMEIFGVLNWEAGTISQSPGSTIKLNSGAIVNVTAGGRGLGEDATLNITDGQFSSNSYYDIGSSLDAGNGPIGTLNVSGSNATYQVGGVFSTWGHNGGDVATVTFSNQAVGTLSAGVDIATNGGSAFVNVLSGAKLRIADHLNVGVIPASVQSRGGRPLVGGQLNAASASPAIITVAGGTLTTTGPARFGAGAVLNHTSGEVRFGGDATFSTGSTFNQSGIFSTDDGANLTIDGGAWTTTFPAGGGYILGNGSTLRVTHGGHVNTNGGQYVGHSGRTGTMIVQDPGSSVISNLAGVNGYSEWSRFSGDKATITFASSGVGSFNSGLRMGEAGGAATVNIQSSARLGTASLSAGTSSGASDGVRINVNGGTLNVTGLAQLRNGVTVNYSAGSILFSILEMSGNAQVLLSSGGNKVLRAGALNMSNTSKIDLNDNDMIVGFLTPKADVVNLVRTARNGGAWNGTVGITSTAAKNSIPKNKTLGVLSGAEYSSVGGTGVFSGQSYAPDSTLVKFTWYGDVDFNGVVDFDDYSRIDAGFNNNRTGWLNGDVDYNGIVDFDDYSLIDQAFNTQSGTLRHAMQFLEGGGQDAQGMSEPGLQMVAQHFEQFGQPYANAFLAAVPEPAGLALIVGASLARLSRRRRH